MVKNYRALNIAQFNNSISLSQTTPSQTPIFSMNIGGSYGAVLTSLSLAFNTSAQNGASFLTTIDGIDITPNQYQQPSQTFNTFNYVASGDKWEIDANAQLKIYAYNSNNASTSMLFDIIATVKQRYSLNSMV